MKTNHTLGPWTAQGPKISEIIGQTYFSFTTTKPERRGDSYVMPGFYYPHSIQTPEEMDANAKLIAAAPELLEALQAILRRFENFDKGFLKADHVKNMARIAIKKATE